MVKIFYIFYTYLVQKNLAKKPGNKLAIKPCTSCDVCASCHLFTFLVVAHHAICMRPLWWRIMQIYFVPVDFCFIYCNILFVYLPYLRRVACRRICIYFVEGCMQAFLYIFVGVSVSVCCVLVCVCVYVLVCVCVGRGYAGVNMYLEAYLYLYFVCGCVCLCMCRCMYICICRVVCRPTLYLCKIFLFIKL